MDASTSKEKRTHKIPRSWKKKQAQQSSAGSQQDMGTMERWLQQDQLEQPWNAIDSVPSGAHTTTVAVGGGESTTNWDHLYGK